MRISEFKFKPINFTIKNNGLGLNQDFIDELSGTLLEVQFPAPEQRIQFELATQIIQKIQIQMMFQLSQLKQMAHKV